MHLELRHLTNKRLFNSLTIDLFKIIVYYIKKKTNMCAFTLTKQLFPIKSI